MQTEKLIEKLSQLSHSERKNVIEYLNLLYNNKKRHRKMAVKRTISKEKIIGMWADKKDMKDSTKWVRKAREQQWKIK